MSGRRFQRKIGRGELSLVDRIRTEKSELEAKPTSLMIKESSRTAYEIRFLESLAWVTRGDRILSDEKKSFCEPSKGLS